MNKLLVGFFSCCLSLVGGLSRGAPATVEDSGADCVVPALPAYEALEVIPHLPDPFLSLDKRRITERRQWTCRREEIAAEVQEP